MTEIKCLDSGFVRLVDSMGDDAAIVQAARVSYGAGTKSISDDRGLIRYLMRNQHTSPLEMVEYKWHIKAPIFVARQWLRHRTANVNEISARYSVLKDDFYIPDLNDIEAQSKTNKQCRGGELEAIKRSKARCSIKDNSRKAYASYSDLLRSNVARELARVQLPTNVYTEWYWKIDLHNLFHFINLRTHSHAQKEIRVYAEAMYQMIKEHVPVACEAFEDYVRQSYRLSRMEIEVIRKALRSFDGYGILESYKNLTKREQEAFDKLVEDK